MTIFKSLGPAALSAAPATCMIPPTPTGTDAAAAPPARRFNKLRRSVSGLRRIDLSIISFRTVVDAARCEEYGIARGLAGDALRAPRFLNAPTPEREAAGLTLPQRPPMVGRAALPSRQPRLYAPASTPGQRLAYRSACANLP